MGGGWKQIDGGLSQITVGPQGELGGCNSKDEIYYRPNPFNSSWERLDGAAVHYSMGANGEACVVNRGNTIFKRNNTQRRI